MSDIAVGGCRANGFTGEVVQRILSRTPNRTLLMVRLIQGTWIKGPAHLVRSSNHAWDVTILGAAFVDGRPPEAIDPHIDFILVEGILPEDEVEPGLFLIQGKDLAGREQGVD